MVGGQLYARLPALSKAITIAADRADVRVVKESVQERRRHGCVPGESRVRNSSPRV